MATRAYDRLFHAFRPATQKTYGRMFNDFMAFLVASGLTLGQVNIYVLLSFLEYLHSNGFTVTNISNYLAGIRAHFILHSIPTDMFKDQRIQIFVKSLQINRPLLVKTNSVFSIDMLKHIIMQSKIGISTCFHCLVPHGFLFLPPPFQHSSTCLHWF